MAERSTLLSRDSGKVSPLQAGNVDARGAFGDARGLGNLGSALQEDGDTGSQIVSHIERKNTARTKAHWEHLHQVANERDASDFQAETNLAITEQALAASEQATKAMSDGLKDKPLQDQLGEVYKTGLDSIKSKLAPLRERNPEAYDRVISDKGLEARWAQHMDNLQSAGIQHSAVVNQGIRFETALKTDQLQFAQAAGNPIMALKVAGNASHDMNNRRDLFTSEQDSHRRNLMYRQVQGSVMAGAMRGDPSSLEASQIAVKQGWLDDHEAAQVEAAYAQATKSGKDKGELRNMAKNGNEQIATGVDLLENQAHQAAVIGAAVDTYQHPQEAFDEVVKPRILADMVGRIKSTSRDGLFVGAGGYNIPGVEQNFGFPGIQTLFDETNKENSPILREMWNAEFEFSRKRVKDAYGNLAPLMDLSKGMKPSDQDFLSYRNSLRTALKDQIDTIRDGRSSEIYANNEAYKSATTVAEKVKILDHLYNQDGIPDGLRIYVDPKDMNQMRSFMKSTAPRAFNDLQNTTQQLIESYGPESYSALISTAKAGGPMAGYIRFAAQQFLAQSDASRKDIEDLMPDIAKAITYGNSQAYKEAIKADPNLERETETFTNAALSASFDGEYNAGMAFAKFKDNKLEYNLTSSPMAQAAIQEGTWGGIQDLAKMLTRYYTSNKDSGLLPANKAAAKMRQVLGAAFLPQIANGGMNDQKSYVFGPISNQKSVWYQPSNPDSFNSQRQEAQMNAAAFDSNFYAGGHPKFKMAGEWQWNLDTVFNSILNGVHMGFNTRISQMPNLDTSFMVYAGLASVSKLKDNGWTDESERFHEANQFGPLIDFNQDMGIMKDGKFIPLHDTKLITGFLPDTVRERIKGITNDVSPEDRPGTRRMVLANSYHRMPNNRTRSYDIQIPSGKQFLGNSGIIDKVGGMADVVVRTMDGIGDYHYTKLSVPFSKAHDQVESLMSSASFFGRGEGNVKVPYTMGNPASIY